MRKYKYSFLAILSNVSISIIIITEIFVLITAANVAVAQLNSRDMLYSPLEKDLKTRGFIYSSFGESEDGEIEEALTGLEELQNVIGDNAKYITTSNYADRAGLCYNIVPDEMFDKLDLPLKKGEKFQSDSLGDKIKFIAFEGEENIEIGSVFRDEIGNEYEVEAVVTDQSYLLSFTVWAEEMTYENFYYPLDVKYDPYPKYFTCESQIKDLADESYINAEPTTLVCYNEDVSDEQIQKDIDELSLTGLITLNEDIARRSDALIKDDFKKLIPPIAAFGIIVLIGIINSSVITSKNMSYSLSVMYCCGASKRSCLKINCMTMLILLAIGLLFSVIAILLIKDSVISNTYGFVFMKNNIYPTAAITLIFAITSIIVPYKILSKNSIFDTLENAKAQM